MAWLENPVLSGAVLQFYSVYHVYKYTIFIPHQEIMPVVHCLAVTNLVEKVLVLKGQMT